jgi:hypothetical protein
VLEAVRGSFDGSGDFLLVLCETEVIILSLDILSLPPNDFQEELFHNPNYFNAVKSKKDSVLMRFDLEPS